MYSNISYDIEINHLIYDNKISLDVRLLFILKYFIIRLHLAISLYIIYYLICIGT